MRAIWFLLLAAAAAPASAGTRAVYQEREAGRVITFEIDDEGNFRAGDERHYRIASGTEVYQVAEVGGAVHVARIEDLAAARRAASPAWLRSAARVATFLGNEPERWERGGRRSVNGWRGREYRRVRDDEVGYMDAEWNPADDIDATVVVVSDDPALEPLGDALLHYTADELYLKRHFISGPARDSVLRSLDELAALGTVIASSEGDIRLVSVEEAAIDPARLALPAEPMGRAEIEALIRAKRDPFRL